MTDIHRVKSWSYFFQAARLGLKTHDVRDMRDRDYKVGDALVLCEFDQASGRTRAKSLSARSPTSQIVKYPVHSAVQCWPEISVF